jgi:hypothetical protein
MQLQMQASQQESNQNHIMELQKRMLLMLAGASNGKLMKRQRLRQKQHLMQL